MNMLKLCYLCDLIDLAKMNYNLNIQKILLNVDKQENPEDKISLLKQAVNIADVHNDIDWGIDLRNMIIRYEGLLSRKVESFSAFAWILDTFDANPDLMDDRDILYDYIWMASVSLFNPDISFEQINNIIEDYRRRLRKAGYSDRSYQEMMIDWSLFIGDACMARKYQELRNEEPIDEMSPSSEELTDMCIELLRGNLDKGIAMSNKFISENKSNESLTLSAYGQLIYYLNKARDERAKIYFDKALEVFSSTKKYPYMLFELVLIMYYASRYDKQTAWHLFEEYAVWETDTNDYLKFDFSLAVLPLLKGEGERHMKLSPKLPYYNENDTYNLSELYDYYYATATKLARLFDKRNENNYFQDQIKWHLKD